MWVIDPGGTFFEGSSEAFREFKARAERAIQQGRDEGRDVRGVIVRLRDDTGRVLFEGTLADAARLHINGSVFLPPQDAEQERQPEQ